MSMTVNIPGPEVMGPIFKVKVDNKAYEYTAGAESVTVPDEVGAVINNYYAMLPELPEDKRQEYWVTFHCVNDKDGCLINDGTKTLWYVEPNS